MKQAGGETLYLKVDRNVQVHDKKVTIGDLAQILCTDKQTENLVKTIKVPQATNGKPGRHTMSVMELIERIQEEVSGLEINNIGEYDFLVTYEAEKQPGRVLSYAKTIFVAALSFFGAAFTMWTFQSCLLRSISSLRAHRPVVLRLWSSRTRLGWGLGYCSFSTISAAERSRQIRHLWKWRCVLTKMRSTRR